jgi:hypothetical protein
MTHLPLKNKRSEILAGVSFWPLGDTRQPDNPGLKVSAICVEAVIRCIPAWVAASDPKQPSVKSSKSHHRLSYVKESTKVIEIYPHQ